MLARVGSHGNVFAESLPSNGYTCHNIIEVFFCRGTASRPALGFTQPAIEWIQQPLSPGLKRLERETDHSCPSSAVVKNVGAVPPLPTSLHYLVLN
jgi:hypothetical protein